MKWKVVGRVVGIELSALDEIEKEHGAWNTTACMMDVLEIWKANKQKIVPYNWNTVFDIMTFYIDHGANLADQLENQFIESNHFQQGMHIYSLHFLLAHH